MLDLLASGPGEHPLKMSPLIDVSQREEGFLPPSRVGSVVGLGHRFSDFHETDSEKSNPHPHTLPTRPRSSSDQIQERGARILHIEKPSRRELSLRVPRPAPGEP